MAEAAPAPNPAPLAEPAPAPQPQPQVTEATPVPEEPQVVQAVAAVAPTATPAPEPVVAEAPVPSPIAVLTAAAHEVSSAVESFISKKPAPAVKAAKPHRAVAARRPGRGDAVVQLGAYRSPQYVTAAWNTLTKRYPGLRGYLPLKARFDSPNGTYWRLSIQGFSSQREAIDRCQVLKSHGGACFVRGAAGDAPVEIASN
jgi:hypothetical protein